MDGELMTAPWPSANKTAPETETAFGLKLAIAPLDGKDKIAARPSAQRIAAAMAIASNQTRVSVTKDGTGRTA